MVTRDVSTPHAKRRNVDTTMVEGGKLFPLNFVLTLTAAGIVDSCTSKTTYVVSHSATKTRCAKLSQSARSNNKPSVALLPGPSPRDTVILTAAATNVCPDVSFPKCSGMKHGTVCESRMCLLSIHKAQKNAFNGKTIL